MRTELIAALFVAAMFITSACMVYGGGHEAPSLDATTIEGTATVDYTMPSWTHPYPSAVVAVTVDHYRSDEVTVLMTGRSRPPNSDPASVQGLVDHLGAELENIGSSATVTAIGESALGSYLSEGNGTLVIASEMNVTESIMLENWVKGGGLLVVIGPECVPFIAQGGSLEIGLGKFTYDGVATEGSLAHSLGLRTVCPVRGLSVDDVLSRSGVVLGHISADGGLTTMATFPLGNGRVLAMGGPIEHPFLASMEDVYAWDLARLLETGAPWVSGPIYHERLNVPARGLEGSLNFEIGTKDVRVSIFSLDDSHSLFKGLTIVP